jgi:hypothetical protein
MLTSRTYSSSRSPAADGLHAPTGPQNEQEDARPALQTCAPGCQCGPKDVRSNATSTVNNSGHIDPVAPPTPVAAFTSVAPPTPVAASSAEH